jgi:diguanylate cyclase (GGDEF)-like protein
MGFSKGSIGRYGATLVCLGLIARAFDATATPANPVGAVNATNASLGMQVEQLNVERKQDQLVAFHHAEKVVHGLSPNDDDDGLLRLQIFEIYCFGAFSSGRYIDALPVAIRGVALATKLNDANAVLVMRGVLAIVSDEKTSTPATVAALKELANQAQLIRNPDTKLNFLLHTYSQLLWTSELVTAVRGLSGLGLVIAATPEIAYLRRTFLLAKYRISERIDDIDSMRSTLLEAMELAKHANDYSLTNRVLQLLGRIEGYAGNYTISNEYLLLARTSSAAQGDQYRAFMAGRNLARNYVAQKDFTKALEAARSAYELRKSTDFPYNVATLLLYQAQAHVGLDDILSARSAILAAEQLLAPSEDVEQWQAEYHRTKSLIFEMQNDAFDALQELQLAYDAGKHLHNEQRFIRLQVMRELSNANQLDYRTAMLTTETQQAQNALAMSESSRSLTQWVLLCSATLLALSGLFAAMKWRDAKKLTSRLQIDSLTGALSRVAVDSQVQLAFTAARKQAQPLSILLLDVDRFKLINDTHGHQAGDQALIWLVERVRSAVRSNDVIGRLGGDEFLVILPGASRNVATATAARIVESICDPDDQAAYPVTVSIGTATISALTGGAKELIALADESMYSAKRRRK